MTRGTAMHGRLKVAAAHSVEACGSMEGAGATSGRGKSTAGRWHNPHEHDLPPVDAAVALDKVAVSRGETPYLLCAQAFELGHVAIALPQGRMSAECWHRTSAKLATEQGELIAGLLTDLADGHMSAADAKKRLPDAEAALALIVEVHLRLRDMIEGGE